MLDAFVGFLGNGSYWGVADITLLTFLLPMGYPERIPLLVFLLVPLSLSATVRLGRVSMLACALTRGLERHRSPSSNNIFRVALMYIVYVHVRA